MEVLLVTLLNGLVYGMLLFMLASGLTLIFSMMGVLNFAHASLYMLGAYFAYDVSRTIGFWPALVVAPMLCGLIGALIEMYGLRRVHKHGHIAELLFTFGLAFIIDKVVQMIWGLLPVPYRVPAALDFPLFTIVFVGGSALAGLAGVIGGNYLVTEPAMAFAMGPIVFVVVVFGGLGSLPGCFIASLIMGFVQTFAVVIDYSFANVLALVGITVTDTTPFAEFLTIPVPRIGALLPYLMLVLILLFKPRGLMGTRDT